MSHPTDNPNAKRRPYVDPGHSRVKAAYDNVLAAMRTASTDEAKAVELFEGMRWPDGKAICPHCGTVGESYMMTKRGTEEREANFRWRCRACGERFTVRSASVFEETRLPMRVWAHAMWRACASKKGVSAMQIHRETRVSYKTALYLMHRIRHAMSERPAPQPPLYGALEADETFVGGKPRRDPASKQPGTRQVFTDGKRFRTTRTTEKIPVVALVQRGGDVRFRVMERLTARSVGEFIKQNAALLSSTLHTDESTLYIKTGKRFGGGHHSVNHSAYEYARPGGIHSNTAESVFSRLKRGLYGTWHSVSKRHLHRYLSNIAFLHNTRFDSDSARFIACVRGGVGRRLQYEFSTATA